MKVAVLGLAALLAAAAPSKPSAIGVTSGDVTDRRRNDNTFAGLEVELKLTGEAAGEARGARATVEKAVDDTGRNLVKEGARPPEFEKPTGQGSPGLKLDLRNPARRAKSVREISGQVEVFLPDRDPAAVASADRFLSGMDRPIASPALKASHTEVTVVSRKTYDAEKKKAESAGVAGAVVNAFSGLFEGLFGDIGENDVLVRVNDPGKKVFGVEVFDAAGKPIDNAGSMKVGDFWILKFTEKVPADASLRIYLMTAKAVVTAPFSLKDVALP